MKLGKDRLLHSHHDSSEMREFEKKILRLKLATLRVKRMVNFYPCIISTRRQKIFGGMEKRKYFFFERF